MIKDVIKVAEEKMQKTISVLHSDLSTMKAGRANPTMLDRIQVDYYGSPCPLNQVANVSAPEPRMLVITPWEKSLLKEIEKAILKSDLGINPSNDGAIIRLLVPELTEETRKNIVKNVKKAGEDAKVAIRSIRRDANEKIKALKKDGHISEDEVKKAEDNVQKVTDKFVKENITWEEHPNRKKKDAEREKKAREQIYDQIIKQNYSDKITDELRAMTLSELYNYLNMKNIEKLEKAAAANKAANSEADDAEPSDEEAHVGKVSIPGDGITDPELKDMVKKKAEEDVNNYHGTDGRILEDQLNVGDEVNE